MNRIQKACLLIMAVLVLSLQQAAAEVTLSLGGCDVKREEYQRFVEAHPDVTVNVSGNIYLSTTEIITAFLTGEFPFDTFVMTTSSFDIRQLIQKGYCGDLSSSSIIMDRIAEMYTPIQQQFTVDEALYGVPFNCYIGYYAYDAEAWAAAGFTEEDVPTTFTAYLDFLERWIERIQITPEYDISICNTFDIAQYGPHSYVSYLTDLLVKNHLLQCSFSGEPIRFDTPTFLTLLERCEKIGQALYAYEPATFKGDMALFFEAHGMRELAHIVPLRLTEAQPLLIKASLNAAFQNIGTQYPDLAKEYLENCIACIPSDTGAYLFRDAEPVEDPEFTQMLEKLQEEIVFLRSQMETADPLEQKMYQERMDEKTREWESLAESEYRYLISPEDLQLYRTYGENLFFQQPSIFDPSTENGMNMKQFRERFANGELSAKQFVSRLDELALMLEMERN